MRLDKHKLSIRVLFITDTTYVTFGHVPIPPPKRFPIYNTPKGVYLANTPDMGSLQEIKNGLKMNPQERQADAKGFNFITQ
jgi:hypothetical protein